MTMYTPHILEEYILVLGIDTQYDGHIFELPGVIMYTLCLPFPELIPSDPLVIYTPNRIELRHNHHFGILPLSY
jgi:hypothetical protein